ncbi:MAG: MBL fold metallo-hydrolase [Corynebacterium sp.]|nr:MBL fold metallo-hydrolase [Corynebacterium sp.]
MKLAVMGSSGSLAAPTNPASGYLLSDGTTNLLADIGPGVLGQLQNVCNPASAHVVFSHLHPDHCLDFPSLLVWRRYHPTLMATERHICAGPSDTAARLGPLSGDAPGEVDDMGDTFDLHTWELGGALEIGDFRITPFSAIHPIESYSLRIAHTSGPVVAYSGDTAYTEELTKCAQDADLFLCEATWGSKESTMVPDMHLSGGQAGRIAQQAGARHLVLIHIPPWADPDEAYTAARAEYSGPIDIATSGMEFQLR